MKSKSKKSYSLPTFSFQYQYHITNYQKVSSTTDRSNVEENKKTSEISKVQGKRYSILALLAPKFIIVQSVKSIYQDEAAYNMSPHK